MAVAYILLVRTVFYNLKKPPNLGLLAALDPGLGEPYKSSCSDSDLTIFVFFENFARRA